MIKYIAYCRKSTDEADRQVLSIESQIEELKEFARKENLEVVDFVTEAKTAKEPGREKFNEIVKRLEKGKFKEFLGGTRIVWPETPLMEEGLFTYLISESFKI